MLTLSQFISSKQQITFLAIAGCFGSELKGATPSFTIPLRFLADNALLVSVHVNGHGPFVCQFDSGGSNSFVLDTEKARSAGLKPTETGTSAGVGADVIHDERLPGATVALGSLQLPNQTVVMFKTGAEDCIFGVGMLRDFIIQVDYIRSSLQLYDPQTFAAPAKAVSVPITLSAGSPLVDALISFSPHDSVHAKLLVDTAVRRYLALSKGFTDSQYALSRVQRVVKPPFFAGGTGGGVELLATRLNSISIGSARVDEPIALLIRTVSGASRREPDGYLGNEFFRRFRLTLDYPHMRMLLEPNQNFHDVPGPYDASGLGIEKKDGRLVVTEIAPRSAADQSGVRVGDILVSLDGKAEVALTSAYIMEKLCRLNGQPIIQVQRGPHLLTFTLELQPVL